MLSFITSLLSFLGLVLEGVALEAYYSPDSLRFEQEYMHRKLINALFLQLELPKSSIRNGLTRDEGPLALPGYQELILPNCCSADPCEQKPHFFNSLTFQYRPGRLFSVNLCYMIGVGTVQIQI